MKSLPAGQRASAGDVLHSTAVGNQTLLGHHVIKVAGVELGEAILLGDMDLKGDRNNDTSQLKLKISVIIA